MRINVVGAGMAGLLAANMLRRHDVIVYEKQKELPNNHHSVLRFRTPEVGEVLGIPFRKVNMVKTVSGFTNVVANSLSYSMKVTGEYLSDRSIISGTVTDERYIAPLNLIEQMAKNIHIQYESDYNFNDSNFPVISTIPMPLLMNKLNYTNQIEFKSMPGVVLTATVANCDAFVSVLFPGSEDYSRATITGNQLMIEFPRNINKHYSYQRRIANALGIVDTHIFDMQWKKQDYFKITEINDAERKKFLRWATVHHNIYSLGRYATWRPKLLLDDLVKDVRKIENWITHGL
jgi:NAD(P)-binding Rossmann-like domain